MEIIISNNANKPIYEQITSQIKAMIMSGELKAGDAIPSMRALAKSIQVSVITVQKAYEDLQRDGFIETTVGRGSFVSAQNKEFYQEEQQRIAEEHLQIAAEIGRTSNISLEKLTEIIYVFLTIFLYLLKCPQSLILSALRAFCFCGKPHISRSIFL